MTTPIAPNFIATDIDLIKEAQGVLAVFVPEAGTLDTTWKATASPSWKKARG